MKAPTKCVVRRASLVGASLRRASLVGASPRRASLVGALLLYNLTTVAAVPALDAGPAPCAPLPQLCNLLGECHPDNQHCPPVTTNPSCGEVPHSGRDGAVLTWGLSYKTASAQECCDRCKGHPKGCNSWTFCGLPVCWGLDTGHNHTYGECWLRRLKDVRAVNSSFRQRGKYTAQWLSQHRRARPGCKRNEPWACSPTHVPYTSGALGGPPFDPEERYVTGGGWGKVFVRPESEYVSVGPPPAMVRRARRGKRRLGLHN